MGLFRHRYLSLYRGMRCTRQYLFRVFRNFTLPQGSPFTSFLFLVFLQLCSFFLIFLSLGTATSITMAVFLCLSITVWLVGHHWFICLCLEVPQELTWSVPTLGGVFLFFCFFFLSFFCLSYPAV